MRTEVRMPKAGYDMENGKVVAWIKHVGDRVQRGEVIAEIETDKAVVEMEALADGTLIEILHGEGEEVPVATVIAYLDDGA
jgi:pyruvate/2-oxoglutarate dehydrogenase complex dihydrolipoamide acyltransferase (E2) component